MAATIIQFANLACRRTVVLEDLAIGLIERLGQNPHVLIPTGPPDVPAKRQAPGIRPANPSADSLRAGTVPHAWAPNRRPRSRTTHRRPATERSTAFWP